MKKVLAFLLVVGFLIGMSVAFEGISEVSCEENADFSDSEGVGDGSGDPAPCGGGEGGGTGGGTPG